MIKDLKEQLDVIKAKRVSPAGTARSKVEEAKQQLVEEVNEWDSVTCLGFPCMDTTCLKHYMVEGDIRIFGQAAGAREERHEKDRMKGDKTGGKGKSAAPDRSLANNRTPGSNHHPGRGQK
jgi:hypothetical protein